MEFIQDLAAVWPGYCAVASMVPNVTFLILNGLFGHRYDRRLLLKVNWASTLSSSVGDPWHFGADPDSSDPHRAD
jgi:hypothetical protein